MKKIVLKTFVCANVLLGVALPCIADPAVRVVTVRGTEICAKFEKTSEICFAGSAAQKFLPVWSKDGSRIAFIEASKDSAALANLIVSDQHGQMISKMLIKPVLPGDVRSGMRHVESVEWLTRDSLAISGSVNPTSTEYIIFDLVSRQPVREFVDDGHGAAFSQDGLHHASVTGGPHFTSEKNRDLKLNIDDVPVLERQPQGEFLIVSKPRWSPDGKSVAVLAADQKKGAQVVARWDKTTGKISMLELPGGVDAPHEAFWGSGGFYVTRTISGGSTAGSLTGPGKQSQVREAWLMTSANVSGAWKKVVGVAPANPEAKARELQARLRRDFGTLGDRDHDFWCANCDLASLPRRSISAN